MTNAIAAIQHSPKGRSEEPRRQQQRPADSARPARKSLLARVLRFYKPAPGSVPPGVPQSNPPRK